MIDRFISTFTLFLGPIFFAVSIYYHQFTITLAILALWMVGRGIKILPHLRRRPDDILLVPVFVAVNFLMALVKLYALVTLREQKWIREHYQLKESKGYSHTLLPKIKNIILTLGVMSCLVLFVFYAFK
jgi:hyaluronan synthase